MISAKEARANTVASAYEKLMESAIKERSQKGEHSATVLVPVSAAPGLVASLKQAGYTAGINYTMTAALVTAVW